MGAPSNLPGSVAENRPYLNWLDSKALAERLAEDHKQAVEHAESVGRQAELARRLSNRARTAYEESGES